MISLGIIDIVLLVIVLVIASMTLQRRLYGRLYVVLAIFIVIVVERLAPGTLGAIGNAIQGINRFNDLGPHLTINPIVTFR